MLRYGWAIAGLGGLGFLLLTVVACAPFPAAPAVGEQTAAAASCAHPTPEKAAECAALAEKILASTVRLEFRGPGGGGGERETGGGQECEGVFHGGTLYSHPAGGTLGA